MNIWRLISFHEENRKPEVTQQFLQNGRIAIGWGRIGSLDQYDSWEEIGASIRASYPGTTNSHIGGPSLWHLYANMRIGDLVIIDAQQRWERVVEITGDYEFNDALPNVTGFPDYPHQRVIKSREDIQASQLRLLTGTRPASGQSAQLVLFHYGSYTTDLEQ